MKDYTVGGGGTRVLLNGGNSKVVWGGKGTRQGCPLSATPIYNIYLMGMAEEWERA